MPDPVVSTAWLAERLGDPKLKPVDASWFLPGVDRDPKAEFAAAHIPGAVFFDIDAISDSKSALPHMLPPPEVFATAVGALGISNDSLVVVYGSAAAARVWWTFRAMGHADVRVLDGGLARWQGEGRPVESGEPAPVPAAFAAKPNPRLVRSFSEVMELLMDGGQVADARPGDRFRGEAPEPRPGLKSGHMPGATSTPASAFIAADGRFISPHSAETLFREAGLDIYAPITTTCGSGVTAAVPALMLARLGRWDAAIYDGSWAEWGARDDAPVAQGS